MSYLILNKITKLFDDIVAVNSIDLSIKKGEFIVIVGPSGCGKTTTLRIIAGLEFATKGQLVLNGKIINNIPAKDRNMAMVFQSYALYPHMTVYQNLSFALHQKKINQEIIKDKIINTTRLLGIDDLLNRKPKQLSGGQRQRVAVCRAIVRDPVLFLFDEPLSNLDAKLRNQARIELKKLQHKLGTTSVYVTHDQTEAMTMGDRIIIMNEGNIQQIGSPKNLYEEPKNHFVASFLGSPTMNFYENITQFKKNKKYIEFKGHHIETPYQCKEGNHYIIGIRPENLKITKKFKKNLKIKAKLEFIEQTGSDSYLNFIIEDLALTIKEEGYTNLVIGNNYDINLNLEKLLFFDSITLERLVY